MFTPTSFVSFRHWALCLLAASAAVAFAQAPLRFYPDDPLQQEPKPLPVEKAFNRKLSDVFDLFSHQFSQLGERQPTAPGAPLIRAQGVNTLGEPMDGAWYTRRHFYRRMSAEELARGTGNSRPPAGDKWTIIGAKSEGITPGFTILDEKKVRYFIKFDPISNPEMATAADSISSRFFYALGYHVPENYLVFFDPSKLVLGDDVQLADAKGEKRKMTNRDIYEILVKVPRTAEGLIRATASLAVAGKPIGPPRYYGTRKDDPNDIVPHEHRRDLRGLHVFAAWLDHDDSRSINNFDALVKEDGLSYIRHYLLDFGSTLGSGSQRPNSPRSGAYFFSWKSAAQQFFTLGLAPPYWALAKYEYFPSIGLFEGDVFDPDKWVPEYPNPAFLNRLPDDEFWAAKQVMAFSDQDIRTLVATGQLTDKKAEAYLVTCLIKRRDKIGQVYFAKVLPLANFRVENGQLRWDNLAQNLAPPKGNSAFRLEGLQVAWFGYDNASGQRLAPLGSGPAMSAATLPAVDGYAVALLTANSRGPKQTVEVYLRQGQVVGLRYNW